MRTLGLRFEMSSSTPNIFFLTVVLLLTSAIVTAGPMLAADADVAELEPFEPFLGTWQGLVNEEKGTWDVSRWERALAGQAVRIRHSVAEGAYGGETFIVWDRTVGSLVYYYFTTAGFYTHGTMSFDDQGRLHSREEVAGEANGVSEVRSVQEKLDDGRVRVETKMLRNGSWDEPSVAIYEGAGGAEVLLPTTASGEPLDIPAMVSSEEEGATKVGAIDVTTVAVRAHKMDAMVAFYTEAFGARFREVDTFGLSSRFGEVGGITLKLVPLRNSVNFEDYPSHQLGLTVPDVHAVIAIAQRHGGRQEGEAHTIDGKVHASVRDPDGNTLELYGSR